MYEGIPKSVAIYEYLKKVQYQFFIRPKIEKQIRVMLHIVKSDRTHKLLVVIIWFGGSCKIVEPIIPYYNAIKARYKVFLLNCKFWKI